MLSFLQFKPGEIAAIMKDFEESGSLAPTRLHLGCMKYMVILGEQGAVIHGKKVCLIAKSSPNNQFPSICDT